MVVGVIVTYLYIKGERIIRESQLEIDHIESKIITNKIELQFGEATLSLASMSGNKNEFNREASRLQKVAIETDSLMSVRDYIYVNVSGTKIRPL